MNLLLPKMSPPHQSKILLIYIEPTPYILGLIDELITVWGEEIAVYFIGENKSQNWNLNLNKNFKIFPRGFVNKIFFLRKLFLRNLYSLIHLAGWGNSIFLFSIFLARRKKIPVVVESDTFLEKRTVYWKRFIKKFLYPFLFKQVTGFLPGGIRQSNYLRFYKVEVCRIYPVNMTVDIASMQKYYSQLTEKNEISIRRSLNIPEEKVVFLYVGRLVKHKGLYDLIEAFKKLQSKSILLIVGEGPIQKNIELFTKKMRGIHYAGRLSGEKLLDIYFASDVVVLPSHSEPWGLVINEAMAAGKPVIVSDRVGCIDDLVVHQKTGFIFKAENHEALREAMESLLDSRELRLQMGKHSLERIADWTLENEAKKVCQVWQKYKRI